MIHYPLDAFDPRSVYKLPPYALERLLAVSRRYSLAEWKHFSSMQLEWYLPAENTKNGTEHSLPITQHAMDLINSLPKRDTYIFSVTGIKPITTRRRHQIHQSRHTQTRPRQLARQREGRIDWLSSIQKWGNATQPRTGRTRQTLHAHPFERTDAQSVRGVGKKNNPLF